jgi:hypothetical protein
MLAAAGLPTRPAPRRASEDCFGKCPVADTTKPITAFLGCNHSVVISQVEAGCLSGSFDEVQKGRKNRGDLTAFYLGTSIQTPDHCEKAIASG